MYVKNIKIISIFIATTFMLSACHGKDQSSVISSRPASNNHQPPISKLLVSNEIKQDSKLPLPLQKSPIITTAIQYYTPNATDVHNAFAKSLIQTVSAMNNTPERTLWYQHQLQNLGSLQVGQCSQSTAGTLSVCHVIFSGYSFDIKLLLTQTGWYLVK